MCRICRLPEMCGCSRSIIRTVRSRVHMYEGMYWQRGAGSTHNVHEQLCADVHRKSYRREYYV